MPRAGVIVLAASGALAACSQIVGAEFDGLEPLEQSGGAATGGSGGASGGSGNASGGASGSGANGGGGATGSGGAAGSAGDVTGGGSAGDGGSVGIGGSGGSGNQCPAAAGASAESGIVLNEIKGQGSGDDYIEIFNKSSDPVDVGDYYIGDDSGNQVRFAAGTLICGRSYVIALLQQTSAGGPHTCFGFSPCFWGMDWGVSAAGEAVFLYDADGVLLDDLVYPNETGPDGVLDGQAYGRSTDGSNTLGAITQSPGMPNQPAN